jgi:hypothetical protein
MNDEIRALLVGVSEKQGYGTTDADLRELLTESEEVYSELESTHRWWDTWVHVVEFEGRFFQYSWAKANGDMSIFDLGWEFDWNSVVEVYPKEIKAIIYTTEKPKN